MLKKGWGIFVDLLKLNLIRDYMKISFVVLRRVIFLQLFPFTDLHFYGEKL